MSAIAELKETLEHTQTASFVTTMLRDLSAIKLQGFKSEFDANKAYYVELHELMKLVQKYNGTLQNNIKVTEATPIPSKRMYVALTSNKRFYGMLNHEIVHTLRKLLEKDQSAACMIIGHTGRQIVDVAPLQKTPHYFFFEKDEPTESEMLSCIENLKGYSDIFVVHPSFINSFTQEAKVTDITHVQIESKKEEPVTDTLDYLFEPEIPKIIEFFTTQIRLVLLARVMLETRLALTGARLMKMQRAREKSEELLVLQRRSIHKEITTVQSMRLLETFSGFRSKDVHI